VCPMLSSAVYDVSSRTTFDELTKWFREIDTYCTEGVAKIVVGNKVDKVGEEVIMGLCVGVHRKHFFD
jgi:GTPase SAR1 family protein